MGKGWLSPEAAKSLLPESGFWQRNRDHVWLTIAVGGLFSVALAITLFAVEQWQEDRRATNAEILSNVQFVRQAVISQRDPLSTNRDKLPFAGLNFEGAGLDGLNLHHSSFARANLENASLQDINLIAADLRHANLRGANLNGAHLDTARLSWADLTGAELGHATLRDTVFSQANLRDTNVSRADFTTSDGSLLDINLEGAYYAEEAPPRGLTEDSLATAEAR